MTNKQLQIIRAAMTEAAAKIAVHAGDTSRVNDAWQALVAIVEDDGTVTATTLLAPLACDINRRTRERGSMRTLATLRRQTGDYRFKLGATCYVVGDDTAYSIRGGGTGDTVQIGQRGMGCWNVLISDVTFPDA